MRVASCSPPDGPDDVDAWVGKTAHNTVTGLSDDKKSLQVTHTDGEATAPSPAGSDLWVSTENASGEMDYTWIRPGRRRLVPAARSDGTKPAPSSISMTFPNDTSTPWAIPLMVLGGLLMLAGGALLVLKPKGHRLPATAAGGVSAAEGRQRSAARARRDQRQGQGPRPANGPPPRGSAWWLRPRPLPYCVAAPPPARPGPDA